MGFFTGSDPGVDTFNLTSGTQKQVQGDLGALFRQIIASLPPGISPGFPDLQAAVPELSNLQNLSLAGFEALARGESSGTRAGQAVDAGRDQIAKIFGQGPADFEEFFRTNVEDPAFENFRERIAPSIRREGVRRGGIFGSAVSEDLDQGHEDLIDALTRERGNLGFQTELANRENVIKAIQLIPGLESVDPQILALMLQAGGVQNQPAQQQFEALLAMLDEASRRIGQASQFGLASTKGGAGFPGQTGFLGSLAEGFSSNLNIDFGNLFGKSGSRDAEAAREADLDQQINQLLGTDFTIPFGGGGVNIFCWVAAEYFGWFTPRWWNARRYILASSFANLYRKHGRTLAQRVRNEPALKVHLRPFFEEAGNGK